MLSLTKLGTYGQNANIKDHRGTNQTTRLSESNYGALKTPQTDAEITIKQLGIFDTAEMINIRTKDAYSRMANPESRINFYEESKKTINKQASEDITRKMIEKFASYKKDYTSDDSAKSDFTKFINALSKGGFNNNLIRNSEQQAVNNIQANPNILNSSITPSSLMPSVADNTATDGHALPTTSSSMMSGLPVNMGSSLIGVLGSAMGGVSSALGSAMGGASGIISSLSDSMTSKSTEPVDQATLSGYDVIDFPPDDDYFDNGAGVGVGRAPLFRQRLGRGINPVGVEAVGIGLEEEETEPERVVKHIDPEVIAVAVTPAAASSRSSTSIYIPEGNKIINKNNRQTILSAKLGDYTKKLKGEPYIDVRGRHSKSVMHIDKQKAKLILSSNSVAGIKAPEESVMKKTAFNNFKIKLGHVVAMKYMTANNKAVGSPVGYANFQQLIRNAMA